MITVEEWVVELVAKMRGIETVSMISTTKKTEEKEINQEGTRKEKKKEKREEGCITKLERLGLVLNSLLKLRGCLGEWGEEEEMWYGGRKGKGSRGGKGGAGGKGGWRAMEGEAVKVSAGFTKMLCEALANK